MVTVLVAQMTERQGDLGHIVATPLSAHTHDPHQGVGEQGTAYECREDVIRPS
jgi:hypothetical protein